MFAQKLSPRQFYGLAVAAVLLASIYPLSMGARVVFDMIANGSVRGEDYPKYIIPYTPVSLALIAGILLLPLVASLSRRFSFLMLSGISAAIFLLSEQMFENMVILTTSASTTLESWQMFMCYMPLDYKEKTAVDILIGDYSPAFKLHFYLIALVLILSILNVAHGFYRMLQSGDRRRQRALCLQALLSGVLLGLCIWACFTAFYRTGELQVSPLSAVLMSLFFLVFGTTTGLAVGTQLTGRARWLSMLVPGAVAGVITLLMYFGEMILLNGNLYRFGSGWFFDGLPGLVLAPVDWLVVLLACGVTVTLCINFRFLKSSQ